MGEAWFIASVGLGCSLGLSLGKWGSWILPLEGLRLLGFMGWSTGGHCLHGHGDSWVFLSAVDLKKDNRVTFPHVGSSIGWHICPVDMGTGLHSFLALGWCLDGEDLGCGRGAVATWGFSERSKNIFFNVYYNFLLIFFIIFFCRYLRF